MTTVMILIRHASIQNTHRLHQDRVVIAANAIIIIIIHRHHDTTKNHLVGAVRAVAVIVAATHGNQIDQSIQSAHTSGQDVNGHRADQVTAVAINVTSIHMNEAIHEVIATNRVAIEFSLTLGPSQFKIDFPITFPNFFIKYIKSNEFIHSFSVHENLNV